MHLLLAKPRGFCAGVVRAIDTVKETIALFGPPVYVKHQIVHNAHVVKELENMGAIFVEELSEVPFGARVIYSAHGIPPSVRMEALKRGLIEIDATCGLVTKVHSAIKRFAKKGYKVILIGHKNHVEILGSAAQAPDAVTVVESIQDIATLPFSEKTPLAWLTQTTLSLYDVHELVEALRLRYPHIETLPSSSICYATTNRQMALKEIARQVDIAIVVGDIKSSNSNRLREVAERAGIPAWLVGNAEGMKRDWLKGVERIGMSAGASTPEEIVQGCVQQLYSWGLQSIEEVVLCEEEVFFQLPKIV
ncbi:MAG: 4-hydroxy-3-methylbut-2-enyl diphosphate reductase [Verrucomicrobiota bacterium]|nr:4-hydroxy-3-methylbut-2-enyl diphosphate reductase [Verrucomicrobiota bacterium]